MKNPSERNQYQMWVIVDIQADGWIDHHSETVTEESKAHQFRYKSEAIQRMKDVAESRNLPLNRFDVYPSDYAKSLE